MKNRLARLDDDIFEILRLAAENSGDDHTIWFDVDSITLVVMEHFTRGSRRLVKKRLLEMEQLGIVERRKFGGLTAWKMAADKWGKSN